MGSQERLLLTALGLHALVAVIRLLAWRPVSHNCHRAVSFVLTAANRLKSAIIDRSTRNGRRAVTKRAEGHVLPSNGR